jgi:hypothetical protein
MEDDKFKIIISNQLVMMKILKELLVDPKDKDNYSIMLSNIKTLELLVMHFVENNKRKIYEKT